MQEGGQERFEAGAVRGGFAGVDVGGGGGGLGCLGRALVGAVRGI